MLNKIKQIGHIAQTLRHLFAFGINDETVVHPMIGKRLSKSNRLSALVFVVRELEVHTTAMQIEAFAQNVEAHHDTLAVPTGSAFAPR